MWTHCFTKHPESLCDRLQVFSLNFQPFYLKTMSVYFFIFKCYLFVLFTGKCCIKCCQTNGARCPWVSPTAFYFFNGDKRFSLTFLPHWVSGDEHAQMDLKSLCMCHCTCISRSVGEINIRNRVDQEQAFLSSTVCLIFPNFFFIPRIPWPVPGRRSDENSCRFKIQLNVLVCTSSLFYYYYYYYHFIVL